MPKNSQRPNRDSSSKSSVGQKRKRTAALNNGNGNVINLSDSDDDNKTVCTSISKLSVLNQSLVKEKAYEVVRYLLISQQKQLPVLRSQILKDCLDNYRSHFSEIFQLAEREIRKIFGIKVYQLKDSTPIAYILINDLKNHVTDVDENRTMTSSSLNSNDQSDALNRCLLFLALSYLYLQDAVTVWLSDKPLLRFLNRCGFSADKRHPVLGDVKKLLYKEFVQNQYLSVRRKQTPDGQETEFCWGERARMEIDARKLLQKFCRIYSDGMNVDDWAAEDADSENYEAKE